MNNHISRLNLYRVDKKYIRDLHNADNRVISVSPQINKDTRVFIGILLLLNNQNYVVPISHPKSKHKKMKASADFDKIFNRQGKLIAVLNFNLMIPVTKKQLYPVNLTINKNDSLEEKAYKDLCINEIAYCRRPEISKKIADKANCLYDLCTTDSGYKGKSRCLDFKKLEKVCKRFNEKKKSR